MTIKDHQYQSTIEEWDRRVSRAVEAHYESCKRLRRHHYTLGIIALIIVAILGSTKNIKIEEDWKDLYSTILYFISISATLLIGLQTFLKYGERAEKHNEIASKYGALRRQIEFIGNKSFENENEIESCLNEIKLQWDKLSDSTPAANSKVWKKVRQKYDRSTFKSKIFRSIP